MSVLGGVGQTTPSPPPRQTPLWSQTSPCGQTDASENNTFPSIGKYRADTPTLREILKAVISQVQIEPERLLPPANKVWGKVIFLHLFVILFMEGHAWLLGGHVWLWGHAWLLGGMLGCRGVCMVAGRRVWLWGACMVAGGMHGCWGACVVAGGCVWLWGGMHGCWGACMVAGGVWPWGTCMVAGGLCIVAGGWGACMVVGGMHRI